MFYKDITYRIEGTINDDLETVCVREDGINDVKIILEQNNGFKSRYLSLPKDVIKEIAKIVDYMNE